MMQSGYKMFRFVSLTPILLSLLSSIIIDRTQFGKLSEDYGI